jgi:hypothetical protein
VAASAIHRSGLGLEICQGGQINRAGTGFWASLKVLLRMSKNSPSSPEAKSSACKSRGRGATSRRPECTLGACRRGLHTVDTLPDVGVDKEVLEAMCIVQICVAEP